MTENHPITPPPELVASLRNSAPHGIRDAGVTREIWLIHNAFDAGADQELKACLQLLDINGCPNEWLDQLRATRRPKPPSLAEQAQRILVENGTTLDGRIELDPDDIITIRAALERLQELEGTND